MVRANDVLNPIVPISGMLSLLHTSLWEHPMDKMGCPSQTLEVLLYLNPVYKSISSSKLPNPVSNVAYQEGVIHFISLEVNYHISIALLMKRMGSLKALMTPTTRNPLSLYHPASFLLNYLTSVVCGLHIDDNNLVGPRPYCCYGLYNRIPRHYGVVHEGEPRYHGISSKLQYGCPFMNSGIISLS